ncbi:hypothetical protein JWJ90_07275 [Desulfobulbus rhabdoformis]|uniref:hypothetical protein n=1 Tax=Desulfobulbus rhabdoformis TaxID=34032 RepID=UPI001966C8AA|nr:hypothetical protein [Desulfobulbus rhabdoformis]MBM9614086.1 hypothetical protein [Desulfobulbus rhabdoformis]
MKTKTILFIFVSLLLSACSGINASENFDQQKAIEIAASVAVDNSYDITGQDVEILKVSDRFDRGPIRLSWVIARLSSKDEVRRILKSNFWIIYFYPKNFLEGSGMLGGGFCSIIDMDTGEVLHHFKDM